MGALAPHLPTRWNGKKAFQLAVLLSLPERVAATGGFKIGLGVAHAIGDHAAGLAAGEPYAGPERFRVESHLAGWGRRRGGRTAQAATEVLCSGEDNERSARWRRC